MDAAVGLELYSAVSDSVYMTLVEYFTLATFFGTFERNVCRDDDGDANGDEHGDEHSVDAAADNDEHENEHDDKYHDD